MTLKQFTEKYNVSYNDVNTGLRKFMEVPSTYMRNVEYDEALLIGATQAYLHDRLSRLFNQEQDVMAKLEHIKEVQKNG